VVRASPEPLRSRLARELLLDTVDLTPDHDAAAGPAAWAFSLWTERLVGDLAERDDDPLVIVVLSRRPLRPLLRLLRLIGACKQSLAGGPPGSRPGSPTARRIARMQDHLQAQEGGLAAFAADAAGDVEAARASRIPARHRAARIGLTTIASLLAVVEPHRTRWALQHLPYPTAKLLRSLMASAIANDDALRQREACLLQTSIACLDNDLEAQSRLESESEVAPESASGPEMGPSLRPSPGFSAPPGSEA
jgi:hypothetical protein